VAADARCHPHRRDEQGTRAEVSADSTSLTVATTAKPPAWLTLCTCLALALATLAVYGQTFWFDMVDFDDPGYVSDASGPVNGGLSLAAIKWAFTATNMANWHPLTWMSYLLDRSIQPHGFGVFHVTSVLLHISNTLLLFGVLRMLTGAHWRSAAVAGLFALHPTRVESVAWISERKDVLSTLFWLLTMWTYATYVRSGRAAARRAWYAMTAVFLVLGLMAKAMLVTLPCVLLLLDLWPLRRIDQVLGRPPKTLSDVARGMLRLSFDKVPLMLIVAGASVMTYLAQQENGAMAPLSMRSRALNAPIACVRYLLMLVWPHDLVVFYPQPMLYGTSNWPLWLGVMCTAIIVLLTLGSLLLWRRAPFVTVGWLWFIGTLTPVIGFPVQVGNQAMADRYTYVPYLGLFIAIVWSLGEAARRWRVPGAVAAACVLLVSGALGWRAALQARVWRNTDALFQHALSVDDDNYRIHEMYASTLVRGARPAEAEPHLLRCVDLQPRSVKAHLELGMALAMQGKNVSAASAFERALAIEPDNAAVHCNLGQVLFASGDARGGLAHLERAVEIDRGNREYAEILSQTRERTP